MSSRKSFLFLFFLSLFIFCGSCSQDYKNISSSNGRKAIIELANNFLTSGNCDEAISTITPLIQSQYVDNDARMVYASAYACKGGINFPQLIVSLKDGSSNIFSTLVKSNYSTGNDGKLGSLQTSASIIRQTSSVPGGNYASTRNSDANLYMVFVQANILGVTIAPLGNANSTTGAKSQNMCGACSASQQCAIEVAIATINDSLGGGDQGSALNSLGNSIRNICSVALGACPTNVDPSVCTAVEQTQGQLLINAINAGWN